MKTRASRVVVLVVAAATLLIGGCADVMVALGWRFGPGFSVRDSTLFAKPPVVVRRGGDYVLTWTQGTSPFFFEPSYEAMEGRLVFALVAGASSGNLAGRRREMKIEGIENVAALEGGGAYWWERTAEPSGRFVRLAVVPEVRPR